MGCSYCSLSASIEKLKENTEEMNFVIQYGCALSVIRIIGKDNQNDYCIYKYDFDFDFRLLIQHVLCNV